MPKQTTVVWCPYCDAELDVDVYDGGVELVIPDHFCCDAEERGITEAALRKHLEALVRNWIDDLHKHDYLAF